MEFTEKVAIITGSAQGIGKEMALSFSKEGAKVVIADLNLEKAEETVKEIKQQGGIAVAIKTDITDMDSIKNLVKETQECFGKKIDILANVAGVCIQEDIFESTEKSWDLTMDINLKGMFFLSKEVAKIMAEFKKGKIINISSGAGSRGFPGNAAYSASKGAINAFSQALAGEVRKNGIAVNVLSPAHVDTEMHRQTKEDNPLVAATILCLSRMW